MVKLLFLCDSMHLTCSHLHSWGQYVRHYRCIRANRQTCQGACSCRCRLALMCQRFCFLLVAHVWRIDVVAPVSIPRCDGSINGFSIRAGTGKCDPCIHVTHWRIVARVGYTRTTDDEYTPRKRCASLCPDILHSFLLYSILTLRYMKHHTFLHYIFVIVVNLVKSLIGEILWFLVGLGGYFIFLSKKSPYNVIFGIPLFLIGLGFIVNSLWSEVLSIVSPLYNEETCFICHTSEKSEQHDKNGHIVKLNGNSEEVKY
jgi:hypothetical protein